jgi:site-specific DNA-methyltransferase (adenine-specific)
MVFLIKALSDPGGLVLDPFMGSGSTGVACMQTGRRFVGIEKAQNYFETARGRIYAAWEECKSKGCSHDEK